MRLSIVSTLYRSSDYVEEFCARASAAAADNVGDDFEIILVNDGSPDDSLDKAIGLCSRNSHITVIDLSRNFGHHQAMMTGLSYAQGERIFLIDSDLEEEPEWLTRFTREMDSTSADVVFGVQEKRKGGGFERWTGVVFYEVLRHLTDLDHPRNIVTARVMTRQYVSALMTFKEREFVISALWVLTGFKQVALGVTKKSDSASTYNLAKKVSYAINAVVSFSAAPLRYVFVLGLSVFLGASFAAGVLFVNRLLFARPPDGWTSLMVSVWLLGGLVILSIGVMGLYLGKVFEEVKGRPRAIIRSVHGRGGFEH